jgi:selenide,water dikinase
VTGFGLLGHLGEMLGPAQQVLLDPEAIPALPGALELLGQGLSSTLAPANARALALLEASGSVRLSGAASAAQQQLWIDPQTCGPLLAALPEASAPAALAALQAAGFHQAALIGRVVSRAPASRR